MNVHGVSPVSRNPEVDTGRGFTLRFAQLMRHRGSEAWITMRRSLMRLLLWMSYWCCFPAWRSLAGATGDSGNGDDEPEPDCYALWKAHPIRRSSSCPRPIQREGELYLMDKAGQKTRFTNNSRHENNPALSRDGKSPSTPGMPVMLNWGIYVLDLDTMQETRLTSNHAIDAHPDWSPDGSKIVFGSFRDPRESGRGSRIYVMNADGTGRRRN